MPGVSVVGKPSRSAIVNWDTEHLAAAARYWSATAEQWEGHFKSIHRGTLSPCGTGWEGKGAEAAQERAFADLVKVRGLADTLYRASSVALEGASELEWARSRALAAVSEGEAAGFTVGEDLSVTDSIFLDNRRTSHAQEHAATIAARASELGALDNEVAGKIATATAPLGEVNFAETAGLFTPLSSFSPPPEVVLTWCDRFLSSWLCHDYYPDGSQHDYRHGRDRSGVWP